MWFFKNLCYTTTMKKLISIVVFLCCYALNTQPIVSLLPNFENFNKKFFPADEGSPAEEKLLLYIEDFLSQQNISFQRTLIDNNEVTTNSYNLEVTLEGTNPDLSASVILVPLDSYFFEEKYYDVSLNQYIALSMIERFNKEPHLRTMVFLFTGAGARTSESFWGAKQYMTNNLGLFDSAFVTVLNCINDKGSVYASGSFRKKAIPSELLKELLKVVTESSLIKFAQSEIMKARLGFFPQNRFTQHIPEGSKGIIIFENHIDYNQKAGPVYGAIEIADLLGAFSKWFRLIDEISVEHDFDYNYQLFSFGGKFILISEFTQIIIYIIVIFLMLAARPMVFYFRKSVRRLTLRAIPFYLIVFLTYFIVSLIMYFFLGVIGYFLPYQQMMEQAGIIYFASFFFIPLFIVIALSARIDILAFFRHNSVVYLHGAILFSYINMMISLAISLSLSFVYLLAIMFLVVSHFNKKFTFKLIFYICAFIPFVTLLTILSFNFEDVLRQLFARPFYLHLLFSYFSLPFVLLFMRISVMNKMFFRFQPHGRVSFLLIFILSMIFLVVVSLPKTFNKKKSKSPASIICTIEADYEQNRAFVLFDTIKFSETMCSINGIDSSAFLGMEKAEIGLIPRPYTLSLNALKGDIQLTLTSTHLINELFINLRTPKGAVFSKINHKYMYDYEREDNEFDYYRIRFPRNASKEIVLRLDIAKGHEYVFEIEVVFDGNLSDADIVFKQDAYVWFRTIYKENRSIDYK